VSLGRRYEQPDAARKWFTHESVPVTERQDPAMPGMGRLAN
jgi:hypothetical protein